MKMPVRLRKAVKKLVLVLGFSVSIAIVTSLSLNFPSIASAPTVAFCFLIAVLLAAFFGDLAVAIFISLLATVCFDFFFLPPVGTFTIAAFPDIIALTTFLLTSVVISHLTASAAENAEDVNAYEKAMAGLSVFGSRLLSMADDRLSLATIAKEALSIFTLEYCSVHIYGEGKWNHLSGTVTEDLSKEIEIKGAKFLQDHATNIMEFADESILGVKYGQVKIGGIPYALIAVKCATLPPPVIDIITLMISSRLFEAANRTVSSGNPEKKP